MIEKKEQQSRLMPADAHRPLLSLSYLNLIFSCVGFLLSDNARVPIGGHSNSEFQIRKARTMRASELLNVVRA